MTPTLGKRNYHMSRDESVTDQTIEWTRSSKEALVSYFLRWFCSLIPIQNSWWMLHQVNLPWSSRSVFATLFGDGDRFPQRCQQIEQCPLEPIALVEPRHYCLHWRSWPIPRKSRAYPEEDDSKPSWGDTPGSSEGQRWWPWGTRSSSTPEAPGQCRPIWRWSWLWPTIWLLAPSIWSKWHDKTRRWIAPPWPRQWRNRDHDLCLSETKPSQDIDEVSHAWTIPEIQRILSILSSWERRESAEWPQICNHDSL